MVDFFSRNPEGRFHKSTPEHLAIRGLKLCESNVELGRQGYRIAVIVTMNPACEREFANFRASQARDEGLRGLLERCASRDAPSSFLLHHGVLFCRDSNRKRWSVVVPRDLVPLLIESVHERLGHPGVYKTTEYLRIFYYWKGLRRDVKRHVKLCDMCQRVKHPSKSNEGKYYPIVPDQPGDLVAVDFYGPLPRSVGGVHYIFVALDVFSKYVRLHPMKRATARAALHRILSDYCSNAGTPRRVLSDNGTQFTSAFWKTGLSGKGIVVSYSSVRHPQSNPAERVMRELGRLLPVFCACSHARWAKEIPRVEELLNITTHSSTGYPPDEVHFGTPVSHRIRQLVDFPAESPHDPNGILVAVQRNLRRSAAARCKRQRDELPIEYDVGELVMLRVPRPSNTLDRVTSKFFQLYERPYTIIKNLGANAYVSGHRDDPRQERGIFNKINCKKYFVAETDCRRLCCMCDNQVDCACSAR